MVADDVDYYRRAREVFIKTPEQPMVYNTPVNYGCPYDCGLCADHEQHSCLALVEICDACNLTCPNLLRGQRAAPKRIPDSRANSGDAGLRRAQ